MTDQNRETKLRKVVSRAAWRLNVIEIAVLVLAAVLSLIAGAITALMFADLTDISYRSIWMVSSVLFFGIPGFFVIFRKSEQGSGIENPKTEIRE